jgi:hypothetical protein
MPEETPLACSLDANHLKRRLAAIAAIGASSLIGHEADGDRHLLRFPADAETRRRLEGVITAESECCAFLDLSLRESGEALFLSVAAPENGQAVADELARAFAGATA